MLGRWRGGLLLVAVVLFSLLVLLEVRLSG
jgi:hypothetical protein